MKRILLLFLTFWLSLATVPAQPQPTPEQLGSIYYAYPAPDATVSYTSAPDGYRPFYISHYGRHGSRWRTTDEHYLAVVNVFDSLYRCKGLTALGEDVRLRLQLVWEDARGRSGNITPLGERQHRDIARRMMAGYPEVFADSAVIDARSSTSLRCAMSMSYFTEALKEKNPGLRVSRRAYTEYMDYIAYTSPEAEAFCRPEGPWWDKFCRFKEEMIRPERLMKSLFTQPEQFSYTEAVAVMEGLYWIAVDLQNTELSGKLSLFDIFEYDELFNFWRTINARMYICNAAYPGNNGLMPRQAQNLLRNIVQSADEAIDHQNDPDVHAADLRFGHDTHLIRLAALLQLKDCANTEEELDKMHEAWQDYSVSPMGANLQLIFFRNDVDDVLVKLLLNEREITVPYANPVAGVYYHWKDLRTAWLKLIEQNQVY